MSSGPKREFPDSRESLSDELPEIISDEPIFKVPEPPHKRVNLLGIRDDSTLKSGQYSCTDSLLPSYKVYHLLSLLKTNKLGELEKELEKLQVNEKNSTSLLGLQSTQKLLSRVSQLDEKLEKAEDHCKMLEKQNSLLKLGFQKNQATFLKWVNYLEPFPEFDSPQKLYKAYLDASIESSAFQKVKAAPIDKVERFSNIISSELVKLQRKTVNLVPSNSNLELQFKELAEVVNAVMLSLSMITKKLVIRREELCQSPPQLDIAALEKKVLVEELNRWRFKAEHLEETLRNVNVALHPNLSFQANEHEKSLVSEVLLKANFLNKLKAENTRLRDLVLNIASLNGQVPSESLESVTQECKILRAENDRLQRQISHKINVARSRAAEFRRIVTCLSGYVLEFQPGMPIILRNSNLPFYIELDFWDSKHPKVKCKGQLPVLFKEAEHLWLHENKSVIGFLNAVMMINIKENRFNKSA